MTPDRIREIRALLQAATPGPWAITPWQRRAFRPPDARLISAAPTVITELLEALEATQGRLLEAVRFVEGTAAHECVYDLGDECAPNTGDDDLCEPCAARRFLAGTPGGEK